MLDLKFDPEHVQQDLIRLGYLPTGADDGKWGNSSKRALKRFKRRARTRYRISSLTGVAADCPEALTFKELPDDKVTPGTLNEIKKWLDNRWKAPLGRFGMKVIANGKLREDVADVWSKLVNDVKAKGGTIEGPYGDTKRSLGKAGKIGASSFSFHIVGRAVDLRQEFSNNPGRRYYVAKESSGGRTYWRIYCTMQGGSGVAFAKGQVKYWDFVDKREIPIPAGNYMDLTAEIEKCGFERIPAQGGWEAQYNKTEWWHFQWAADKQETFEDECELVGISSKDLKATGYSEDEMDRKPG